MLCVLQGGENSCSNKREAKLKTLDPSTTAYKSLAMSIAHKNPAPPSSAASAIKQAQQELINRMAQQQQQLKQMRDEQIKTGFIWK